MNNVMLTGYMKSKTELRTSQNGVKYIRNIICIGNDKNKSIEYIPFIAFNEEALTIDKAGAGLTLEIRGKLKSDFNKEKKTTSVYVMVDEVQLTNELQSEEAFIDNPVDDDAEDDLPF